MSDAVIYSILAHLYNKAPDDAMCQQLRDYSPLISQSYPAYTDLVAATLICTQEELQQEYFDLFIGLGTSQVVPFASWYDRQHLFDRPLLAIRRSLARLGLRSEAMTTKDPEDHIGFLLEVMAILLHEQQTKAAMCFFADHVSPFADCFITTLMTAESARFYKEVGKLTQTLFAWEREMTIGEQQ